MNLLVRAPASSANLGPGFDCLALAVDLPFWFSVGQGSPPAVGAGGPDRQMRPVEVTHPAAVAFTEAGGPDDVELACASPIPPGRGLGFSGAARVAGAFAARRLMGDAPEEARSEAFVVAARLEGHGDNAAASAHGGFVVVAGDTVVPLRVPDGLRLLAWSPRSETSTDSSRAALPATVALTDAAFSIARSALWVAAITSQRLDLLTEASQDRIHQPARLPTRPDAAAVLAALESHSGVLAAWLSGSGPTVAALLAPAFSDVETLTRKALSEGQVRVLELDAAGVREMNR